MLRIAEARRARGWSQEQLAQAIGTTQQTIGRWESGQIDPQIGKIEDISRALGITISFLLGIDDLGESGYLSEDEKELISYYRMLTPKARYAIFNALYNYFDS